jgi:hypothetical protein
LCFNVICPTVSAVLLLISLIAGTASVAVAIAVLVREGFRHGDVAGDVRVRARTLAPAVPGAAGRWVEVTLSNPSTGIALAALSLQRARLARLGATTQRRTAGRRTRLGLGERILGAVPARKSAQFHLWAEGDVRSLRLLVAVGTPGRMRLHRLPLPGPVPTDAPGAGARLVDPRERVRR